MDPSFVNGSPPRLTPTVGLPGRGTVAWAVLMVLLLWQLVGADVAPERMGGHRADLQSGVPAPHPGVPFEQAMRATEAEPEPGRSTPPSMKPVAPTALFARAAAKTQAPVEALAFHAQRPRRPLGQAPPRAT
ncbi:hypothetical protein [Stenotrophomonas sp. CFBP 13725]|uniref:hypothetical protein n=1 Tax=Stenotrophomonas sp. CFBP 13725 TaxID=2775297 RepID=UPI001782446E|nr:hypothetical protein [Stenotrophomonas sp. CFBP 13725]MBD8636402.1 hypothetical protein [Stenotrophomonas sp. CFBP 13725]